jgi:hypothetical protein
MNFSLSAASPFLTLSILSFPREFQNPLWGQILSTTRRLLHLLIGGKLPVFTPSIFDAFALFLEWQYLCSLLQSVQIIGP